jgi:hypothetical protein
MQTPIPSDIPAPPEETQALANLRTNTFQNEPVPSCHRDAHGGPRKGWPREQLHHSFPRRGASSEMAMGGKEGDRETHLEAAIA